VVGAGVSAPTNDAIVEEVGRGLAAAGYVVVCGGLGGVMEAACRGAKAEGGVTVGLLPRRHRADANPWVDVAIPTGLGEARNALVVRAAAPEEPILVRIYPTDADDSLAKEQRFHRLLAAADHERSTARTGGTEWFLTSVRFLDEVADVLGLEVRRVGDLDVADH
jgi:hypothetical protein